MRVGVTVGTRVRIEVDELYLKLSGQVQKAAALAIRLDHFLVSSVDEFLLCVASLLCIAQYQTYATDRP